MRRHIRLSRRCRGGGLRRCRRRVLHATRTISPRTASRCGARWAKTKQIWIRRSTLVRVPLRPGARRVWSPKPLLALFADGQLKESLAGGRRQNSAPSNPDGGAWAPARIGCAGKSSRLQSVGGGLGAGAGHSICKGERQNWPRDLFQMAGISFTGRRASEKGSFYVASLDRPADARAEGDSRIHLLDGHMLFMMGSTRWRRRSSDRVRSRGAYRRPPGADQASATLWLFSASTNGVLVYQTESPPRQRG